MKEMSRKDFVENIENIEITEPIKINEDKIVIMPYKEYADILKTINPKKLKEIEEELAKLGE